MYSSDSTWFLPDLEGTEVTLDSPAEPSFSIPRQTWVITKKLSERAMQMRQKDIDDNLGPPFTAAKCLCHLADDPAKVAFMRIYAQIPIVGTEFQRREVKAKQAAPPRTHAELTALKALKKIRCGVVPDLLGYQEGVQNQDGPVPGGYITHVVWDKVPGEPLSPETFWSLEFPSREEIRAQFRKVYEKIVRCGYQPLMATSSKIILDRSTGQMHISGFRRACAIDSRMAWSDINYVKYDLAEPSSGPDWYIDSTGWTW